MPPLPVEGDFEADLECSCEPQEVPDGNLLHFCSLVVAVILQDPPPFRLLDALEHPPVVRVSEDIEHCVGRKANCGSPHRRDPGQSGCVCNAPINLINDGAELSNDVLPPHL